MSRILSLNLKLITALVFAIGIFAASITTSHAGNKRQGVSISGGKKFYSGFKSNHRFKRNIKSSFGKSHRRGGHRFNSKKQFHTSHRRSGIRLGGVSGGKYYTRYNHHRNVFVKRSSARILNVQGAGKFHHRGGQKFHNKKHHASTHRSSVHLGAVSGGKYYKRYKHQRNVYDKRSGAKIVGVTGSQTNNSIYAYGYDGSTIEQDLLDDGSDYSIAIIRGPSVAPVCPEGFNCGYRLYEDGTGPRIITPGMTAKGLPPQDGITGARIIRVK